MPENSKNRKLRAAILAAICGIVFSMTVYVTTAKTTKMSKNKETVNRYMDGFRATDRTKILSCLTEDVIWKMPGVYFHAGKTAFNKEITNESFVGNPDITVTRLVEEGDVVIAEGKVQSKRKDGGMLNIDFCDVFIMENSKIKQLTSYVMDNGGK